MWMHVGQIVEQLVVGYMAPDPLARTWHQWQNLAYM